MHTHAHAHACTCTHMHAHEHICTQHIRPALQAALPAPGHSSLFLPAAPARLPPPVRVGCHRFASAVALAATAACTVGAGLAAGPWVACPLFAPVCWTKAGEGCNPDTSGTSLSSVPGTQRPDPHRAQSSAEPGRMRGPGRRVQGCGARCYLLWKSFLPLKVFFFPS